MEATSVQVAAAPRKWRKWPWAVVTIAFTAGILLQWHILTVFSPFMAMGLAANRVEDRVERFISGRHWLMMSLLWILYLFGMLAGAFTLIWIGGRLTTYLPHS